MPSRELRRTLASFPITKPQDSSTDSSALPRNLPPLVSGTTTVVNVQASPTGDQDVSDGALHSQAGSNDRATGTATRSSQT